MSLVSKMGGNNMLKNYMGIINLDENEDKIRELTRNRPLASIPIAGRYRIIDFILSNMTNAGIENIGIFTKMKSRSLMDHLSNGRPWDLNRKINGLRVFNFTNTDPNNDDIYNFSNNLEYLYKCRQENVILSSSYMICNIDFKEAVKYHEQSGNDITVIYKKVKDANENFLCCETLNINECDRLLSVGKNIGSKKEANICMEMYIMKKDLFVEIIKECVSTGKYRKVKNAIYNSLDKYKVGTYRFEGFLRCINSLKAYYSTSMELLDHKVNKELFSGVRPIYTKTNDEVPARYTESSDVSNSIIGNGCFIEGTVENSIIFRKVNVGKGAVLRDCIILQNCVIGENSSLSNIITDKYVEIDAEKQLKGDKDIPLVVEKEMTL